jgi:hypothetical protein
MLDKIKELPSCFTLGLPLGFFIRSSPSTSSFFLFFFFFLGSTKVRKLWFFCSKTLSQADTIITRWSALAKT